MRPLLIITVLVAAFALLLLIGAAWFWLHDHFVPRWQLQRQVQRLGAASVDAVVDSSPYRYDFWQGEGYRIWHRDRPDQFVAFAASEAACKRLIVRLIHQERASTAKSA
ncbi:MAG: hypothetical protein KDD73_09525 [Anaerolineales bacterium]|nr:hypothetical protein [Anaerolineales bacterium]MCB9126430.1 hypothetical protein [Ardenticatenales bacterium]MCB9171591.1 hypothetical protein [Ardenticatenales bacterium]